MAAILSWPQFVNWSNDGLVYWLIYASPAWYFKAWTKWLTFCPWYFQKDFPHGKWLYFDSNLNKVCCCWTKSTMPYGFSRAYWTDISLDIFTWNTIASFSYSFPLCRWVTSLMSEMNLIRHGENLQNISHCGKFVTISERRLPCTLPGVASWSHRCGYLLWWALLFSFMEWF